MQNLDDAYKMLDLFTSVGARSFVGTKTDIEQKLIWGRPYSALELRDKLPAMVRTAASRKRIIRPAAKPSWPAKTSSSARQTILYLSSSTT
jgi:hypothetical protein